MNYGTSAVPAQEATGTLTPEAKRRRGAGPEEEASGRGPPPAARAGSDQGDRDGGAAERAALRAPGPAPAGGGGQEDHEDQMIRLALRNFEVALRYEPGTATLEDIGRSSFGVAVWATSESANPQTTPLGRIPAGPDWRSDLKGTLRVVVGPDYRRRALCESVDGSKVF